MKRILVTILAFLYLGISTGATVHLHYCMGKFLGASLWHDDADEHECDHCGMTKLSGNDNDCCKEKHKLIKSEDQHIAGAVFSDFLKYTQSPAEIVPGHSYFNSLIPLDRPLNEMEPVHAPPGEALRCPKYILIRSIRI